MKVLHVSDYPLPDARVEKMAYLSKKRGWETFFAGPGFSGFALGEGIFDGTYYVPWNRYVRLGIQRYFRPVRRILRKITSKVKPNIIHAHNIFSAKMVCDFGYPFVFDDHELASLEKKSQADLKYNSIIDAIVKRYEVWKWGGWEREVSTKAPIVAVSNDIANFYRKLDAKVFVIPNYPSLFEMSKARLSEEKEDTFTAVYLGNDLSLVSRPYRSVKGLTKVFKELGVRLVVIGDRRLSSEGVIISKGYIPHLRLYNVMSRYHVGLLPWKKHWFHDYANPNKPYMYAHSGMAVVVTSSLRNVVRAFEGKVRTIEDYSELRETLLALSQSIDSVSKEGKTIRRYALDNLVFEQYEDEMIKAYENAS